MTTKALIVSPVLATGSSSLSESASRRSPQRRLEEACGLAEAIDLKLCGAHSVTIRTPQPATLFGKGKVTELKAEIDSREIDIVVVDASLSPIQQRNLEREWDVKVVDRTGLILEIFGARAKTREGRLQVELAHLTYQKSRLVRSWTHLERQRGGVGFLGGPGETQIEADRRVLAEKIGKLEGQLEKVRRTRRLHRKARRQVPYPIVALVGYTNAGKSTLFNLLTKADVLAKDLLFATLDPSMRALRLPNGLTIILSDTVGFIADLPTELIAAFRATLEEVVEADVIVHVRDVADPDTEEHRKAVEAILAELIDEGDRPKLIEICNKIDRLTPDQRKSVDFRGADDPVNKSAGGLEVDAVLPMSALTGEGKQEFLIYLEQLLAASSCEIDVKADASDGEKLAWLYRHGEVLSRHDGRSGNIRLRVRFNMAELGRYEKKYGAGQQGGSPVEFAAE